MSNYGELEGVSLREVQDQLLMLLPAEFFLPYWMSFDNQHVDIYVKVMNKC